MGHDENLNRHSRMDQPPPLPPQMPDNPSPVPPAMPENPYTPQVPPPSSIPDPPRSSGMKWLGCGCGGCLALLVVLGVVGFFGFKKVVSMVKGSPVYKEALVAVQNSPEVRAAIGEPIADSWMAVGNREVTNGAETANYTFNVKGPKGEAVVVVAGGVPSGGTVTISQLIVTVQPGGNVITLVPAAEPKATPAEAPPPAE